MLLDQGIFGGQSHAGLQIALLYLFRAALIISAVSFVAPFMLAWRARRARCESQRDVAVGLALSCVIAVGAVYLAFSSYSQRLLFDNSGYSTACLGPCFPLTD
jgi:ABC-type Mn2+/Zn2+ transport system permease subunit